MTFTNNLSYFLNRVAGFSTQHFKIEPQNSTVSKANRIIRFKLPSNTLLNTRSMRMMFNAKVTGTTAGGRLPADIRTLINRIEVSAGGVTINQGFNDWNVLLHAQKALCGDDADPVLGHPHIVRNKSYVDGSAITGTDNETYTDANGNTQFAIYLEV